MQNIKKILILFKTHLDIGFTDMAGNVLKRYREEYIPNALRTARELRESGGKERLLWTTGSFLIWNYLRTASDEQKKEMEEAIRAGDISWHALPCTTHTELMDEALFRYGLSLSKELDARFGRKTIGAKLTDVPGHTIAMVPYLAEAGIQFLHIGVNPASTVPDVPDMFRWQFEGSEVIVMYNSDYGRFTQIPGTETAVYFAHTGDNHGPQSPDAIVNVYREIAEKYPDAVLQAADLSDVAREIVKVREKLPVVTSEIGDTWIHGTGSDPWKVRLFREMLRRQPEWSDEERREAMRTLLLVPEHTWGMDIKTHLADHEHYIRSEFEKVRETAPNYKKVEASWEEQRAYVTDAVEKLTPTHRAEMLKFAEDANPDETGFEPVDTSAEYTASGWTFSFGSDGSLNKLKRGGDVFADEGHRFGEVFYENYSPKEYGRFFETYVTSDAYWAKEDFGKIGMEKAVSEYALTRPVMTELKRRGDEFVSLMELGGKAHGLYGAPGKWEMHFKFEESRISFELRWEDKPACRVPEAIWCGFRPVKAPEKCRVRKIGKWIDPLDVCSGGGKHLHATDYGVRWNSGEICTPDTALVSIGNPRVMPFTREDVDAGEGVWFNLVNNIWGTNFVMWYSQNASFRWIFTPDRIESK
ncbi:MAG: DUF5054 domain-containing protein [Eubacteriales bacterium]